MIFTKTKIVVTIGPASSSYNTLEKMIIAGADICRINFSHGTHAQYQEIINNIRKINIKHKKFTAILADLQGPKIRIGKIKNDSITLKEKQKIIITTDNILGNEKIISINYKGLIKDIKENENILLNDGKIVLKVLSNDKVKNIEAIVINGGKLSSNKGVNLPNTKISLPSLTEKDLIDLDFALKCNVEWIGLSFVRDPIDIIELKKIIKNKKSNAKVVAKIEKPEAVAKIDDIIKESDAVMIARGDLGVEIPMEKVPIVQKNIVKKAIANAKPCIIATQMIETMINNYSPTRAEVNDVANAVMDGTDAVMLSEETSIGKYPVRVIEVMKKIIAKSEQYEDIYFREAMPIENNERFISDSILLNSCRLAQRVKAEAIATMTDSGYSAFKLASFRPKSKIFVFTSNTSILTMLNLVWGVKAFYYDKYVSTDHTIADIKFFLKKNGYLKKGDLIINIASMPITEKGMTNMLKLSYVN